MRHHILPLGALLTAIAAGQAPIETIHSTIFADPSSAIPGYAGGRFERFRSVRVSPDGQHWTLEAKATGNSTLAEVLLIDGQLFFQAIFFTPPWSTPWWTFGTADIENDGMITVDCDSDGTLAQSIDGGTTWSVVAQTGMPAPGISGAVLTDFLHVSSTEGGSLVLNAATAGPSGTGQALYVGGQLAIESGVTVPSGQVNADPIGGFGHTLTRVPTSDDGQHWLASVVLSGSPTYARAVVRDGAVVLQQGVPVAGAVSPDPPSTIDGVHMDGAGGWTAWGKFGAYDSFAVHNGALVAETGQPITPGSSETWAQLNGPFAMGIFSHVISNAAGDVLVCGGVESGNGLHCVKNGTELIVKTGDAIDLDGNGLFDDDIYFHQFEQIFEWTADGTALAVIRFQNAAGQQLSSTALVRVDLGAPSTNIGTVYCQSNTNSSGLEGQLMITGSRRIVDDDVTLSCASLPQNSAGFFLTSQVQGSTASPGGSQGILCLAGGIGRYSAFVLNSGPSGTVSLPISLTAMATPNGPVAAMAGETWSFQYWFRDANPTLTSNFSNGVEVTLQ